MKTLLMLVIACMSMTSCAVRVRPDITVRPDHHDDHLNGWQNHDRDGRGNDREEHGRRH